MRGARLRARTAILPPILPAGRPHDADTAEAHKNRCSHFRLCVRSKDRARARRLYAYARLPFCRAAAAAAAAAAADLH